MISGWLAFTSAVGSIVGVVSIGWMSFPFVGG